MLSNAGKQLFGSAMAKSVITSSSSLHIIGQPVIRIDARVKVTGEAQFSADRMAADGLLYGKTLRSPHPHAEIIRIDTAKAARLPGIRAVVTFHDAPENPFEDGDDSVTGEPLAPVYLLIGSSVMSAMRWLLSPPIPKRSPKRRCASLKFEYRALSFVLDAESALAPSAPPVRGGSNLAGREPILLIPATLIAAWRKRI